MLVPAGEELILADRPRRSTYKRGGRWQGSALGEEAGAAPPRCPPSEGQSVRPPSLGGVFRRRPPQRSADRRLGYPLHSSQNQPSRRKQLFDVVHAGPQHKLPTE